MTLSTVVYWISVYFEYVPPRILEILSKSISLRNCFLTINRIEMAGNIFLVMTDVASDVKDYRTSFAKYLRRKLLGR